MDKPFLSICIPTYNRADIVYQCVIECLKIPHDWIEVAVTNNCSTDDTMNKLRSIGDSRLKLYENEKNIGYYNYTNCLLKGRGDFCVLLSDEDEFIDTDWLSVRTQLEMSQASVFSCKYYDEAGGVLVNPGKIEMPANEYETFCQIKINCRFSGAIVFRRNTLEEKWNLVGREQIPHISFLYNYILSSLNCAVYANYGKIENMSVRRTKRNNKGNLDTRAWCAGTEEPYWSINSRKIQMEEWINYFKEFPTSDFYKKKLSEDVVCSSIYILQRFWRKVNEQPDVLKSPLYSKYHLLIERDRAKYDRKWISSSLVFYKQIGKVFDSAYGKSSRNYTREYYLIFIMVLSFCKAYIKKYLREHI